MRDQGRCVCLAVPPEKPDFREVAHGKCGDVCATEGSLLPKRYCGGKSGIAIFRIESIAEVREEIETGKGKDIGKDVWPSWPQERKGFPQEGGQLAQKHVIKGVSYGPVPLRARGRLPDDDFMSESTQALWGSSNGRGDLAIIKALGANTVRLYGNDPTLDHSAFLDEAMKQGLEVIAGLSDYPFTQMPGNCVATDFNCYEQVKSQYTQNLKRGFLSVGNVYHPALRAVILMNEADLKFHGGPRSFCKALISAFDAALDAEQEMGVAGQAPAFTATFSFGVCARCSSYGDKPAVGQMIELRRAMMHPESVGYHAKNDLWAAYQVRFINSINTANPATDIRWLFLDLYDREFPQVPVFIGEYHNPRTLDQKRDLETILRIAADGATMLQGISFFEYQVRYDKGGSEEYFGMFGLEERSVTTLRIGSGAFSAYCLRPLEVAEITEHMYKSACGSIEVGVDYVSASEWAIPMDHIPTPDFCCQQCKRNPKCRSWTWVEDAALTSPGQPSQCWLKGGLPLAKVPKDGVVSGVPALSAPPLEASSPQKSPHDLQSLSLAEPREALMAGAHLEQMRWSQCGGKFWAGPVKCAAGWQCKERTEFYSQCTPSKKSQTASIPRPQSVDTLPNIYVHMAVTAAFGGPGVSAFQLCPISLPITSTETTSHTETSTSIARTGTTTTGQNHLWFGCFKHPRGSKYVYSNEKGGFTSSICAEGCKGYAFALLHNGGHCSCGAEDPRESHFHEVETQACGKVCPDEEALLPRRYCGGQETFAVYQIMNLSNGDGVRAKGSKSKKHGNENRTEVPGYGTDIEVQARSK